MQTTKKPNQRNSLRDSRSSVVLISPVQGSPFSDSPKLAGREARLGISSLDTRNSRTPLGSSLSQAKIDRWAFAERMRAMEAQLEDRDRVLQENMDLKDRVRASEHEQSRLRDKFSEINAKVRDLKHREETWKAKSDAELADARDKVSRLSHERDQMSHDNCRLRRDLELVQEEISRLRELASETIDRSIHERIVRDIKIENESLRKSVEESVPCTVYDRVLSQLQESSMSIADKSRDISELKREVNHYIIRLKKSEVAESESIVIVANLRDELLEMERSNDRFTRRLVELNRLVESKNKSKDVIDELDTMKNELAEANKRTKLLLSELSVKAENEKLLNHSMEIVKSDKSKMVKRVLAMKEEVKILKLALENEKVDFNESIKTGINEIQLRFDNNIQQLIQGVWKLLVTLELVHDSGDIPNRVTDLVLVLKSALTASTTELSRCRNAYRAALTDNEELVRKASLLEEKLRRLNSRISSFESNRISEDLMMSKLRESIESAETRLNRARPPAVNPR